MRSDGCLEEKCGMYPFCEGVFYTDCVPRINKQYRDEQDSIQVKKEIEELTSPDSSAG